jgi:hypothetical protein
MKRFLAIAALLVCFVTEGRTEFTGMQLVEMCANKNTKDICEAWIAGFQAGLSGAHASRNHASSKDNKEVCLPKGFTGSQATLIIKKYMQDHPQVLHLWAPPIAFVALWDAFPCPKTENSN